MPQAWQKRAMERQQFVEYWKGYFIRDVEGCYLDPVSHGDRDDLIVGLYGFLHAMVSGSWRWSTQNRPTPALFGDFLAPSWKVPKDIRDAYLHLMDAIKKFSRTDEERQAIMAEFLDFFNGQITEVFRSRFRTQHVLEPEKLYGGKGATEEVPLEEARS